VAIHTERILSLFSGCGGLDLGVRIAVPDARTVCYVEREAFSVAVLAQAMGNGYLDEAPVWSDVETFNGTSWRGKVDGIIASPPCQPFSVAGKRKGLDDERGNIVWHVLRIIDECQPEWAFFENVMPWVTEGHFQSVRERLSDMGYECEIPIFLGAKDVGAPHQRRRVFIMAYRNSSGRQQITRSLLTNEGSIRSETGQYIKSECGNKDLASSSSLRLWPPGPYGDWTEVGPRFYPAIEPGVCGVAYGMAGGSYLVDRNRALGNGVVPLVAAMAFRILATNESA